MWCMGRFLYIFYLGCIVAPSVLFGRLCIFVLGVWGSF